MPCWPGRSSPPTPNLSRRHPASRQVARPKSIPTLGWASVSRSTRQRRVAWRWPAAGAASHGRDTAAALRLALLGESELLRLQRYVEEGGDDDELVAVP